MNDIAPSDSVVFASAAALRLLLAVIFPRLPDLLTSRVEISTPVNSFKRLQEGLFLYERGVDPYDGGIFHQAPLFLPLFALFPSASNWFGGLVSVALYTSLDCMSAACLYRLASSGAAVSSQWFTSPRKRRSWKPITAAAVYLFNPFTLLACLGRPTSVFTTFFVLLSASHASQAKPTTAAFALAMASVLGLHPVFLVPPVGLLCYDRCIAAKKSTNGSAFAFAMKFVSTYAASAASLLGISRFMLPSWKFLESVYLFQLQLPDLTPNPGLWWYFFTEMFDPFRSFFLGVFWLHMLSYSVPFCLRLLKQPLAAFILMAGVIAIFEPYANIGDSGVFLSCLSLLGHVFEVSSAHRYSFPALAALLYGTLLGPAFHHLWIHAGSGNANFFYAINLVWGLSQLILLTDTLYSLLRDEWEKERPEGRSAEVRQI